MMWNIVRECLREGRDFLYRHDLRNLTYVRLLPQSGQRDIARRLIESTEATEFEKEWMYGIFEAWQSYCNLQEDSANRYILRRSGEIYCRFRDCLRAVSQPADEYRGCYVLGLLTSKGDELRVAAGARSGSSTAPG